MQLFFGFVGTFNVLLLWPVGVLLHLTGMEPFETPPTRGAWQAIFVNVSHTILKNIPLNLLGRL